MLGAAFRNASAGWMGALGKMGLPTGMATRVGGVLNKGFGVLGSSPLARHTLGGAALGAGWGAVSPDTSVLGGATLGAGLAAGVSRYGGNFLNTTRTLRNVVPSRMARATLAGQGMLGMMRRDINRGVSLVSNRASNGFSAMRRGIAGWTRGMAPF